MAVGVKDIFHVDGFVTQAGSRLPAHELQGNEAESVTRLKDAGALIFGKTVTTEFAYFSPGPTRNPHNPEHTPGGSSSGSAAAVGGRVVLILRLARRPLARSFVPRRFAALWDSSLPMIAFRARASFHFRLRLIISDFSPRMLKPRNMPPVC